MKKNIQSDQEFYELIKKVDWAHAFIREINVISPSYIDLSSKGTVAPDSLPAVRILIHIPDFDYPAIDFTLYEVQNINFDFRLNLEPYCKINNRNIELGFSGSKGSKIRGEKLSITLLNMDCWGYNTYYGKNNIFDEAGFPLEPTDK